MTKYLSKAQHEITDYPGDRRDRWRTYWRRTFPFKEQADIDHLLVGFFEAASL